MNKKQYVASILLILTTVVFFNHKEYFTCKDQELSYWDEIKIFMILMERPKPCPGNEEITKMTLEFSLYLVILLSLRLLVGYLFRLFDKWLKDWMERNWKLVLIIIFVLLYFWSACLFSKNAIKNAYFLGPKNKLVLWIKSCKLSNYTAVCFIYPLILVNFLPHSWNAMAYNAQRALCIKNL